MYFSLSYQVVDVYFFYAITALQIKRIGQNKQYVTLTCAELADTSIWQRRK